MCSAPVFAFPCSEHVLRLMVEIIHSTSLLDDRHCQGSEYLLNRAACEAWEYDSQRGKRESVAEPPPPMTPKSP